MTCDLIIGTIMGRLGASWGAAVFLALVHCPKGGSTETVSNVRPFGAVGKGHLGRKSQ